MANRFMRTFTAQTEAFARELEAVADRGYFNGEEIQADQPPPFDTDTWELYSSDDWTQAENIAAKNPKNARTRRKQLGTLRRSVGSV